MVVGLVVVGSVLALLVGCGSKSAEPSVVEPVAISPAERTVHVRGVACSQPRDGVGVDLGTGLVLTSGHVVDGLTDATILRTPDREDPARIVHIDRRLDVAILAIDDWFDGAVVIADIDAGEAGIVHLRDADGNHHSVEFSVDRRILAQTLDVGRVNEVERPSLQLTTVLERGDSGAGLWDDQGSLVGVLWAISTSVNARAFGVQGDELNAVITAATTNPSGPSLC